MQSILNFIQQGSGPLNTGSFVYIILNIPIQMILIAPPQRINFIKKKCESPLPSLSCLVSYSWAGLQKKIKMWIEWSVCSWLELCTLLWTILKITVWLWEIPYINVIKNKIAGAQLYVLFKGMYISLVVFYQVV